MTSENPNPRDYDRYDESAVKLRQDAALARESEVGRLHGSSGRPMDYVWEWSESYRRAYRAARRDAGLE
jgi:hypothetical protein